VPKDQLIVVFFNFPRGKLFRIMNSRVGIELIEGRQAVVRQSCPSHRETVLTD
jgi:hypothetical protein